MSMLPAQSSGLLIYASTIIFHILDQDLIISPRGQHWKILWKTQIYFFLAQKSLTASPPLYRAEYFIVCYFCQNISSLKIFLKGQNIWVLIFFMSCVAQIKARMLVLRVFIWLSHPYIAEVSCSLEQNILNGVFFEGYCLMLMTGMSWSHLLSLTIKVSSASTLRHISGCGPKVAAPCIRGSSVKQLNLCGEKGCGSVVGKGVIEKQ